MVILQTLYRTKECTQLKTIKNILVQSVVFSMCLFFLLPRSFAGEPAKVIVFPFVIHAAADQAFLKQAVMDMLYTRLSGEGRTVVIESQAPMAESPAGSTPLPDAAAVERGRAQQADYVLVGSLTLLGDAVSTDARLLRTSDQKPLVTFNQSGQGQGAVIEHVDALAARIKQDVFLAAAVPQPAPGARPAAPPPPAALAPALGELAYWKSDNFKTEISSLAIGDLDGDDRNETVFVDRSTLYVYRYYGKSFELIETLPDKTHNAYIRVDVADINRNGKAEIFVTNYISSQKRLQSFVLEWNGSSYETLSEKSDWYYRVAQDAAGNQRLLGQKGGSGDSIVSIRDALFQKEVFELQWQSGQYVPKAPYKLPGGMIIFGHVFGYLTDKKQPKIATFSEDNYLTLLNADGEKEWQSDEPYGGSPQFFEVPNPDDSKRIEHFYLPQRIYITDFDRDGANEIIVVKNHDAARALSRTKVYKEGVIECLSFDAIGAQLKWQTRKISGYISDYALGDFDNDGKNDLVFVAVAKQKSILSSGLSGIVAASLTAP